METPYTFLKFVTQDRIDILKDGYIRFTPPKDLNDPFEVNPVVIPHDPYNLQLIESGYDYQNHEFTASDHDFSWKRFNKIGHYKNEYSKFSNKYGILSLSSSKDMCSMPSVAIFSEEDPRRNLLMWSHYTDEHRGFIIEFHRNFIDDTEISKITYSHERPMVTQEEIESGVIFPFFVKGEKWCYEKERRIIKPLEQADKIVHLDNGNTIHLFKIKKSQIRSITTGCNMDTNKIEELKKIVFTDPELKNCIFYVSKIDNEGFALDFRSYSANGWTNDDVFGFPMISRHPLLINPENVKKQVQE
ncbi:DUF2971 domain-containing protein [Enterobacter hormaechei]|uniref:DUF2971 domain-containing protein n=1 Tax=Enterobacter hormaechei TaxID=158836 RepID=UPI001BABDCF7|nr:DUF2971 domain-containing protein [Enterobacter hormaechei]MBS0835681.1 DUF2971 domain-containing protein [Enterobacter hormaechei]